LGRGQCPKLLIPVGFKRIGHQAILGIDLHEPFLCRIGVVAGARDVLLSQPIGLVQPLVQLLLHDHRDFEGMRSQDLQKQAADRLVNAQTRDALANPDAMLNGLSVTQVVRDQADLPRVIPDGHAPSAKAAQDHSLQESWPSSWGAPAMVAAVCLGVFPKNQLIPLVLVPTDVSRMGLGQQRVPLVSR
jgi:hypothetical protein